MRGGYIHSCYTIHNQISCTGTLLVANERHSVHHLQEKRERKEKEVN